MWVLHNKADSYFFVCWDCWRSWHSAGVHVNRLGPKMILLLLHDSYEKFISLPKGCPRHSVSLQCRIVAANTIHVIVFYREDSPSKECSTKQILPEHGLARWSWRLQHLSHYGTLDKDHDAQNIYVPEMWKRLRICIWLLKMNDWCVRPRFSTLKAIVGRRHPSRMRRIL